MGKKILYCAVVLTENSQRILYEKFKNKIPNEWEVISHHMTIEFGKSLQDVGLSEYEGQKIKLKVNEYGYLGNVMAVGVEGFKSFKKKPHVTLAIDVKNGGKPVLSNKIKNWVKINEPFYIDGVIKNIYV